MDIRIRGAAVHNLRSVDLDLPRERLIVFCGVSGSGKSSLAFDTLHAESQRRFIEALSSFVRQQLGQSSKPAFEELSGLTPSIGVAQRGAVAPSPRATVATITDTYDLLRVLYARAGTPHCPQCGRVVTPTPLDTIVRTLAALPEGTPLTLCAPVARKRTGGVQTLLDSLAREGFARVRVDGTLSTMEAAGAVDAREPHDVDVVVDRVRAGPDRGERLQDSLTTALKLGRGAVLVLIGDDERFFATRPYCVACDLELPPLQPRTFSFNSPHGACPDCQGVGTTDTVDMDALVDSTKTLLEGAFPSWKGAQRRLMQEAARRRGIPLDVPWQSLPWQARDWLLHGGDGIEGAVAVARRKGESLRAEVCGACAGQRLNAAARAVTVENRSLPVLCRQSLDEARTILAALPATPVTDPIREELCRRLDFLIRTGLGYLTLDRIASTLSGGEIQRARLAAQAGNQLSGVLYVLDEPTAGLHPADTRRLLDVLLDLRNAGNTVLVVEHDPDIVRAADHVVEFGPGAGVEGGKVVFEGAAAALLVSDTLTARWLTGRTRVPPHAQLSPRRWLRFEGLRGNNLRGDVRLPLGVLSGVTGVSGSGKSSLIEDTLAAALTGGRALPYAAFHGREFVRRVIRVDQTPLGRSSRSNAATATKLWDTIRELYARTPEAKARGFSAAHFSFNTPGGRCEACEGEGTRRVAMHFLPDVMVPCEVCDGRRYDDATLSATWKGATIADVLTMSVRSARTLFAPINAIAGVLETLDALGLGYLPLGQPGDTLSGGEAQRIKLAKELGKPGEIEGALYLLDEPSVGLHPADVALLVEALRRLVTQGASVLVIDHDPVLLGACDWLTELGPGAGEAGGRVIAEGTPAELATDARSVTGRWL